MKCNHEIDQQVQAVEEFLVDSGPCPICLQDQLFLAKNVVEAADNFLDAFEFNKSTKELYSYELRDAIAKFKGGER